MDDHRGMFGTLFDFSFTHFITAKLVKLLFAIGVLGSLIGGIRFIAAGFGLNAGWGVLALLVSPVVFLILVLFVRVWLEIIIVLFRIAENVQKLAEYKKNGHTTATGPIGAAADSPDGASTVISMDSED